MSIKESLPVSGMFLSSLPIRIDKKEKEKKKEKKDMSFIHVRTHAQEHIIMRHSLVKGSKDSA